MSVAVLFPGQGSQSIGMLKDLAEEQPIVKLTFEEASDVLGTDLWSIAQTGPAEKLNSTDITQPAMLAAGIAVWRVWLDQNGCNPSALAGHSLGEYTALVAAKSLAFSDGVELVSERAQLMQNAVTEGEGAMAAILGLSDDDVIGVCKSVANGQVVEAVNFNSPGQVVIAGESEAVERAMEAAKEVGAKRVLGLPVSVPSHCTLMKNAASELLSTLEAIEFSVPEIPVYHNVDAKPRDSVDDIREALSLQLHQPVRWVETITNMIADGTLLTIEMGPGRVLNGLNRRIDRSLKSSCVMGPASLGKTIELCEEVKNG